MHAKQIVRVRVQMHENEAPLGRVGAGTNKTRHKEGSADSIDTLGLNVITVEQTTVN